MADETFGRLSPRARRKGVTQRLSNPTSHFPGLRDLIVTRGQFLGFDSTRCDIDVLQVFRVAERAKAAQAAAVDPELVGQGQEALSQAAREYLPGWDGIEFKGTLGGSAAGELIAEVRDRVVAARRGILGGLADVALARRTIPYAMPS